MNSYLMLNWESSSAASRIDDMEITCKVAKKYFALQATGLSKSWAELGLCLTVQFIGEHILLW